MDSSGASDADPTRDRRVAPLLAAATRRLKKAGSTSPRLDATLLLGTATGWSRAQLLAHPERCVPLDAIAHFWELVERRARCEPTAYILGVREFYGRPFRVDRRVLIPRPESEALVDVAVDAVRATRARGIEPRVLDVGTGSGALAVSVAAETGARVVATDTSWAALAVARENAVALGQPERVWLVQADLVAGLRGPFHVLIANLPYLPTERTLERDVSDFEPAQALFGGRRGPELVERLLRQLSQPRPPGAPCLLAEGSVVALEIDQGQGNRLALLARALFPDAAVEVRRDAASLERVLLVRLPC